MKIKSALRLVSSSVTRLSNRVWGARSYRRVLLDEDLQSSRRFMKGFVLDVGGKAKGKTGEFHPLTNQKPRWIYLNLGEQTRPDILGNAVSLPFQTCSFDSIVCTEVLEHCEYPQKVVDEIHRVLKPGGHSIISVPFICPIHADPYDFCRFTDRKLRSMLSRFNIIELKKQGYYFTVIGDMVKGYLRQTSRIYIFKYIFYPLIPLIRMLMLFERTAWAQKSERFTSYTAGFFVICRKEKSV